MEEWRKGDLASEGSLGSRGLFTEDFALFEVKGRGEARGELGFELGLSLSLSFRGELPLILNRWVICEAMESLAFLSCESEWAKGNEVAWCGGGAEVWR